MTPSAENIHEELAWRGLIFQESGADGVREYLTDNKVTVYCGFDPTADSLHIGNLVPLITLRRFQQFGHKALALAGGATGLIGDPSGKSAERNLQTPEVINSNLKNITAQLAKIVDLSDESKGELVNNYDWFSGISVIDYLRDIGKSFSVTTMLQKDSVSGRIEQNSGISYTEFSYQVLQGYDFLHLYRTYGCTVQIGGSDQWGNMIAGMDQIRRNTDTHGHCLTVPLITTADGKKFGKSEKGAIYLNPDRTCPYEFYQYWFNVADDDVLRFMKFFTFMTKEEIDSFAEGVETEGYKREAQKRLAWEMTVMIHGEIEAQKAIDTSAVFFGKGEVASIDARTFESLLQSADKSKTYNSLEDVQGILQILSESGLAPSNRNARELVKAKSISLNDLGKIEDDGMKPSVSDLLHGHYMLIRKGKKHFAVIKFENI